MKTLLQTSTLVWLLVLLVSCSHKQASVGDERLKWNQATTLGDYEKFGVKDARWDGPVKEALASYAKVRSGMDLDQETKLYLIGSAAEDAVKAGCKDPLVEYLNCSLGLKNSGKTLKEKQDAFSAMAKDMQASSYSPLRKYYANVGAAVTLWSQRHTNLWPQVREFRRDAMIDLAAALEDKTLPVEEAYHATHELFQILEHNTRELTNAYDSIEKPLFKNWPKAGTAYLIKGEFYLEYAWRGRGNANADRVSDEQWKMFFGRLGEAETALNEAWSLNPKDPLIPTVMIGVAEGQQKKRPEMETWFERAMQLNTNNYEACRNKLHYLYPEWNGSREDMIAFGRECVTSTKWGGHVPLILVDAHSKLASEMAQDDRGQYWSAPEVWTDIKGAYEKFAQLNPDETRFRYPYAFYAMRCRQWADFNEQIQLIQKDGADFNYNYFGGKEEFEKLVAMVKRGG
ncbi:MAG: hypothetical protein P4N60_15395 [Verrucomicrobiae bacterium]|nr:hypothetical protein [Verrucomicrobiae bacterium]